MLSLRTKTHHHFFPDPDPDPPSHQHTPHVKKSLEIYDQKET